MSVAALTPEGGRSVPLGETTPLAGVLLGAVLAAGSAAGHAQTAAPQPLWEVGLGVGGLRLPHYRGSDQSHSLLLPVPYVVYRGRILKADRGGARAVLFESDRVDFDLSLAASPPTKSDNRAREGMDDLAPTVEIGPNLNLTLARTRDWKLDLRVPVRAAITIESRPRAIGWTMSPVLNLDLADLRGWRLGVQAGPEFGTRRYHGYFYDVPQEDARPDRPAYRASGGYSGAKLQAGLSRRFERTWAGAFLRYDHLAGARYDASPLVRREHGWSFGVAVSWVLATSSRTVVRADDE